METEDQEKEIRLCEEPIVLGKEEYFAGDGIDISDENVISIDKNVVQEKLTAGTGINISEQNDISVDTGTIQEKLTAGNNINISEQNVISATDTTYTAGENINISAQNVISATDTKYTAGKNITISEQNVISAADGEVYTAGDNITIQNNVISATDTKYTAGNAISIDSSDNNRIDADIHPADYFTADASELIADGSAEGTMQATFKSVELYGDTTQQTYSGKNLFDISKVISNAQVINNNDGTLTINAPSGSSSASAGLPNKLSDYCPNLKVGDTATLSFDTTGNEKYIYLYGTGANFLWGTGAGARTKTVTQAMLDAMVLFYASGSGTTATISNFQIELGSTPTDYEPYVGGVPAPNPDYPQDVNVVTGTQTVTVTGKNLFNSTLSNYYVTSSNAYPSANHVGTEQYFEIKPNTNYTLSITEEMYRIFFVEYDSTKTVITQAPGADTNHVSFTSNANAKYARISFSKTGTTSMNPADYVNAIQLEESLTPTAYEPYQSQSYTVRLGSLELAKIGNYQDYIYKSGDDWYVHKATGNQDITSIFSLYSSAGAGYIGGIKNASGMKANSRNNGFCNKLTPIYSPSGAVTEGITFGAGSANQNIYIILQSSRILNNTLEGWNTYLGSNPMTVYYPLDTPTDTQITDADLVSDLNALASGYTYADETNFTITATGTNLPAPMEFEVYKNSLAGMAEVLAGKQDKLVAGSNINITGNVISALGGGSSAIQTLTAADFNWDSTGQGGEPNVVAAWLLNEGWYCASVETHPDTSMGPIDENSLLYVYHDENDPDTNRVFTISGVYSEFGIYFVDSNGESTGEPCGINIETLAIGYGNNLPIIYSFPPDGSTVGALGQLFTDTGTMHTYQCTAIDDSDPDNTEYIWTQRW